MIKEVAVTAAREAGSILMDTVGTIEHEQVTHKQTFDFVTHADKASEEKIIEVVRSSFPSHRIYAEESVKQEPGGYRWIIDPLDGTTNFIHGYPVFSVSIGVEYEGEMVLGVVFDPSRDDLYVGEKDKGATLNGHPIGVSDVSDPAQALLVTGFPFRSKCLLENYQKTFSDLFHQVSGIRRLGSAALDLCQVACGRADGFWEVGLAPWDVAAGALIIQEAGGLVRDFSGTNQAIWTGDVVAANSNLLSLLLQTVTRHF